ncbi:MAG: molybdopterin-dependent oxidoreductase [Promethearchaeota archaeon]
MDKNIGIGIIIGLIIATGIFVPTYYFLTSQNRQDFGSIVIALSLMEEESSPPTISLIINGTAVSGAPITLNLTDFIEHSYLSRDVLILEKRYGEDDAHNYTDYWTGIPLVHLIYDIANVSSYNHVNINASDFSRTFDQADIDNTSYFYDLLVAYKMNGEYLDSWHGPIRFVVTQDFSVEAIGWPPPGVGNANGFHCVRKVIFIEINS